MHVVTIISFLLLLPLTAFSGQINFHIPHNGIYFNIEKLSLYYPENGKMVLHSYINLRGEHTTFSVPEELNHKQIRVYYDVNDKGLDFFASANDTFTIKMSPFDTSAHKFEIIGSYENDYYALFFSALNAFRSEIVSDIKNYSSLKKKEQRKFLNKWKQSATFLTATAKNYKGKHPVLQSILFFECPKITNDFAYWNSFLGWNYSIHFKEKVHYADTFLLHSFVLPNQIIEFASRIDGMHFTDPVEDPHPRLIDSVMFVFDKSPVFTAFAYNFLYGTYQSLVGLTNALDYLKDTYGPSEQCKDNNEVSFGTKQKVIAGTMIPSLPYPNFLDSVQKGDTVLIVFWSSHCSYCSESLPFVSHYTQKRNLKVLAISLDHSKEEWEDYTSKYPNWVHFCDFLAWKSPFVKSFEVEGTPSFFLVSGDGKLIGRYNTWKQLGALLK